MKTFFAVLLLAGVSFAQTHVFPAQDTNNTFTGQNQFTLGAVLGPTTVAGLAFLSPSDGTTVVVSDSAAGGCTVGGGTTHILCVYNANSASWVSAGSSGSGLPSGCTGASGAISCNSAGVAFNAPNGTINANGFATNGTAPDVLQLGDNNSFTPSLNQWNLASLNGNLHLYNLSTTDLGILLTSSLFGVPNGVAGLNASGVANLSELATNPANCNNTTFFRGDNTCNTPNAFANASQAPNATSPGTVLNEVAFPCNPAATSCTAGTVTGPGTGAFFPAGIVNAGAGTTGNATIQYYGSVPCVFDNGTTLGDYVVGSTSTGCHDAGGVLANIGIQPLLGISQATNVGAGTYLVWLVPMISRHVVAQGTTALATATITSATCATVVTATATNANPTFDNLSADFSADPTSTTGYSPSAAGILTIIKFITANTVNFKVCNNTGGNITPGAVTLKWSVWR